MKISPPETSENSPEHSLPPVPPNRNPKMKKTRDLPNLSECNCCNRRINTTNPKNRLRILSSEWRIILLCKNCYHLIKSSQFCSYCLSRVSISSIESVLDCRICNRRIHTDCVTKFRVNRGNGDDLSVCFDCWVPDLLLNDYIRDCNVRTKRKVRLCDDLVELGSSRVCDLLDKGNSVKILANEANEKVAVKSVVGNRVVELVNDNGADEGVLTVEDDAKLAIQLHRAMNSSSRLASNSCMLDNRSNNAPMAESPADIDVVGFANGVSLDVSLCGEENGLCMVESSQDCVQMNGGTQDEKCNGYLNGYLVTYSRKRRASLKRSFKEKQAKCIFKKYSRRSSRVQRHTAESDHQHDACDRQHHIAKRDHQLKTYRRRPSATSHCKKKLQCSGFDFMNGVLKLAALNCFEESKAVSTTTS